MSQKVLNDPHCPVCNSDVGGSFTHHSNYIGLRTHVSTIKSCRITGMHCASCCMEPGVAADLDTTGE